MAAIIGVVGALVSAVGTIASGMAQKKAADFEAKQLEIKAQEERAASQREALEKRREKEFVLSRQQAGAAASGLGALDPTVLDLAGDVEQQGSYNEAMVRYGGEERARGLRAQAAATRMSGEAAKTGAMFSAVGTIFSGFSGFASKYGGSGPASDDLLTPRTQQQWYYG
jgi:adenine-specific DNA methylase